MFALLGVVECPSAISVSDLSLITVLPRKPVEGGVEAGWAEPHPLAGYGPIPGHHRHALRPAR